MKFQSNVLWGPECYVGADGSGVSTDKHRTHAEAENVCDILEAEGFGCMGEYFPIRTWVTEIKNDRTISR